MTLFLQIFGGVVLSLIILAAVFYLYVRIKFRSAIALMDEFGDAPVPLVVHLNEDFTAEWQNDPVTDVHSEELASLGFKAGKCYVIPEMPQIELQAYFADGISAVLYHNPVLGHWCDFCFIGAEGEDITVTNAVSGSEIEHPPESVKIHLPGESLTAVYERFVQEIDGLVAQPVTAENFREYFEKAYQKDMSHMANRGGVTYDEFLTVHANSELELSGDKLKQAFLDTKEQELDNWHDGVIEAKNLWDLDTQGDVIVVPKLAHSEAYLTYLAGMGFIDHDDVEQLLNRFGDQNPPEIFQSLNESRSESLRASHVQSVDLPLKCEVYLSPYSH